MYLSFYNLKVKPFQITTDPRFLWMGEKHREALATLEYGIQENKGFLLLTGDVGTGKTALINQLIRKLDIETRVAAIPDPGLEKLDFLRFLAKQFNISQSFKSKGAFLIKFREFLEEADAKNSKVLLIIDEAQRLHHELLEEIRLLSNIELHDKKLINIFFVGQNEFNQLLMNEQNRAVQQRISVRYELDPLTLKETKSYIEHRLKVAGCKRKIFTTPAVEEIFRFSKGNPRLTNIICDHALLTGYARNIKEISNDVIAECVKELRLPDKPLGNLEAKQIKELTESSSESQPVAKKPSRPLIPLSFIFIILIAISVAGYMLYQEQNKTVSQWSAEDLVPQGPQVPSKEDLPHQTTDSDEPLPGLPNTTSPETEPVGEPLTATDESTTQNQEALPVQKLELAEVEKIIIYFNHNSNELPTEAYETLDHLAQAVNQQINATIEIKGYTDSSGSASYNQSMSKFRANIIKSYLVGKGIDPALISTTGLGAANPIASNDTPEGRKRNRRVEIIINRSAAQ